MTILYTDPVFTEHKTPPGHPERPERLAAIAQALAAGEFAALHRRTAEMAPWEAVAAVHPPRFIEWLEAHVPESGLVGIDGDTVMSPHSLDAARTASGSAIAAVDAVLAGEAANAFVASRPPGHHAEKSRAMGFCLINHVAVAARHAQKAHGIARVAIVDFDVHHGNGTQDVFWDDPSVLYVSTHQSPLYPGTGAASERGAGNILNLPLPPGTGGRLYRTVFDGAVMPAVSAFEPEIILVSAGFDAHRDDPLGGLQLSDEDFVWITARLMDVAARVCEGRIVSVLEGGYDLPALGRAVAGHVSTLCSRG